MRWDQRKSKGASGLALACVVCNASAALGPLTSHSPVSLLSTSAHTPDNSFLGFVVEQHLNSSDIHHINEIKRQNQSLVYGKVDSFWKVSQPACVSSSLKGRL